MPLCRLPLVLCFVLTSVGYSVAAPTAEDLEFFEKEVRPLLATHCYECHSVKSKKLRADLLVDSRARLLKGGESGPALVPHDADGSPLIQAVRYEAFEMPPSGKLSDSQIATLERWVAMGAPWPDEPEPTAEAVGTEFDWEARRQQHWCWQPITNPTPPSQSGSAHEPASNGVDLTGTSPIDRFIRARLGAAGLPAAHEADRRDLVRRLYFDLIGLPPSVDQVRAFLENTQADAYESLVDQLLESPAFGEKWARHWLDLVRFAETLGHEFDYPLHHAYQYRDYLIRAFNQDVPYDQLIREHIAGDLLVSPRMHPQEDYNESVIGTGFWFLGEAVHAPTDVKQDEATRIDNQIDVMCKAFLGLTVACARCHDHKFDPIPTTDYYALAGFLQSSRRQEAMLDPQGRIHHARVASEALHRQGNQRWHQVYANSPWNAEEPIAKAVQQVLDVVVLDAQTNSGSAGDKPTSRPWERPTDPRHVLAKLARAEDFVSARDGLRNELIQATELATSRLDNSALFADFTTGGIDGWYLSGEAFAALPTDQATWQPFAPQQTLAPQGLVHSGLFGRRFRGVLRSPTFVLPRTSIHYRMQAKSAQIRLIVDGYTMDEFSGLLFADAMLKNVDTGGELRWVTQHHDLYHYVGHRAHLEIIDHGDGFVAVQEIRFSDEEQLTDAPHPLNLAVLSHQPTSREELTQAYVQAITRALQSPDSQFHVEGSIDDASLMAVTNWLIESNSDLSLADTEPLRQELVELDERTPTPMPVIALTDGDAEDEFVFIRGNHLNLGEPAPRRMLLALGGNEQSIPESGSGRLELANQIASPHNPLTSRVAVNRVWHYLFGRGIVPTVDDFGKMGQLPSHPELLDWLAYDFSHRKAWSVKELIREIVLSRTYRMSSTPQAAATQIAQLDPENELLHRAPVRRLTAEAIRDSLLSLSGQLDPAMFGPSIPVHLTSFMEGRGRPQSGPLDGAGRRSLYVEVRRNFLSPMMLAFDRPSPFNAMGRRSVSNVPSQSLILMNDPFVAEQAEKWAQRLVEEQGEAADDTTLVQQAFEMAFARPATPKQLEYCLEFLQADTGSRTQRLRDMCHMLVNMKPFIYIN